VLSSPVLSHITHAPWFIAAMILATPALVLIPLFVSDHPRRHDDDQEKRGDEEDQERGDVRLAA